MKVTLWICISFMAFLLVFGGYQASFVAGDDGGEKEEKHNKKTNRDKEERNAEERENYEERAKKEQHKKENRPVRIANPVDEWGILKIIDRNGDGLLQPEEYPLSGDEGLEQYFWKLRQKQEAESAEED